MNIAKDGMLLGVEEEEERKATETPSTVVASALQDHDMLTTHMWAVVLVAGGFAKTANGRKGMVAEFHGLCAGACRRSGRVG